MFQSLKLPANRMKKFPYFHNFFGENRNMISRKDQNEMLLQWKLLARSNPDTLLRNLYIPKADYNLTGISDLGNARSNAQRSPSGISISMFVIGESIYITSISFTYLSTILTPFK